MAQPSKKEVIQALLERAEARVHLDGRREGVILPDHLRGDGHVRLDYGYGFSPPIPDLVIDDQGIHATLSFRRVPFRTFVPWSSIYLIADFDGNGAVWQEDLPKDLVDETETEGLPPREPEPDAPRPGKKPRPNHLKLVK